MLPWAEPGSLTVTASRRLARHLRLQAAALARASGAEAWPASRYVPWDAWLRELWDAAAYEGSPVTARTLLSDRQSAALWARCAKRALGDVGFAGTAPLAAKAAAAWQRAVEWRVSAEAIADAAVSPDGRFLARAAREYLDACERGGWQDPAGLPEALMPAVSEGIVGLPRTLTFAGFQRMTPLQQALVDAVGAAGTAVDLRAAAAGRGRAVVAAFESRDAELMAAGAWARERLLADPGARVAIVVPGLSRGAQRQGRLIAEGLNPGWQLAARPRSGVNLSYGRPLADYALVDSALALLGLVTTDPEFLTLSRLLRSPYIGGCPLTERARLERALRELPDRHWPAGSLNALGQTAAHGEAADFMRALAAVAEQRDDWRRRAWPAAWAERIDALLAKAGWSAGEELGSDAYQLVNAWRGALNDLAGIGRVTGEISGHAAIRELEAIARDRLFQPESAEDALPVMGLLEASGLAFDALWVAGMDSTTWPPPQRPDPLLPMSLQREHGMPDASPEDTLRYAEEVFEGLLASAPEIVVSWPRQDGEALLSASPLLDGLAPDAGPALPDYFAAGLAGTGELRLVEPDTAPAVSDVEEIPGGHGILSVQRTQPFDAFVQFRLRARPLETPLPGLSARDRGNVVHRVLEALYRRCAGGPVEAGSLAGEVDGIVTASLRRYRAGADGRLTALIDLEAPRLSSLIRRFLEVDAGRGVIAGVQPEESRRVRVGPLTLDIRPDRIDAVAGGWLIIDYKTGVSGTAVGDDPAQPTQLQLVTYAISQPGRVLGLAVAVVHPHRVGFVGVRDPGLDWPGGDLKAIEDWPGLLNAWKAQAHALAESIARGDARLNLSLPAGDQRAYAVLSRHAEMAAEQGAAVE